MTRLSLAVAARDEANPWQGVTKELNACKAGVGKVQEILAELASDRQRRCLVTAEWSWAQAATCCDQKCVGRLNHTQLPIVHSKPRRFRIRSRLVQPDSAARTPIHQNIAFEVTMLAAAVEAS